MPSVLASRTTIGLNFRKQSTTCNFFSHLPLVEVITNFFFCSAIKLLMKRWYYVMLISTSVIIFIKVLEKIMKIFVRVLI